MSRFLESKSTPERLKQSYQRQLEAVRRWKKSHPKVIAAEMQGI